mgnify:FL=1
MLNFLLKLKLEVESYLLEDLEETSQTVIVLYGDVGERSVVIWQS